MNRLSYKSIAFFSLILTSSFAVASGMSVRSQGSASYTSNSAKDGAGGGAGAGAGGGGGGGVTLLPQTSPVVFSMAGISSDNNLDTLTSPLTLTASGGSGGSYLFSSSNCTVTGNSLQFPSGVTSCSVSLKRLGDAQYAESASVSLTVKLKEPAVCAIKYINYAGSSNPARSMNTICNQWGLVASPGEVTQKGSYSIPPRLYTDGRDGWLARDKCSYNVSYSNLTAEFTTTWNNHEQVWCNLSNIAGSTQNRRGTTFICKYAQQATCPSEISGQILVEKLNP